MFLRSPKAAFSATGSVIFSTGTDSPVSAASSICSVRKWKRRRSAGTLSPLCMNTTSPGTSSAIGNCTRLPSRWTVANSGTIALRLSIALPALYSCAKPMIVLMITTARITRPFLMPSAGSTSIAITALPSSTQINGLLIWPQISAMTDAPPFLSRTLAP